MDYSNLKVIPNNVNKDFGLCVYGKLTDELKVLANNAAMKIEEVGDYINFYPTEGTNFNSMFDVKKFKYMDGFSPNLNKFLHIGHFSNLVLAKAYQGLGICDTTISILGDTLTGEVKKDDALAKFFEYCKLFEYKVDTVYFASEMKCDESMFIDGEGDYEGTKIAVLGDEKVVAIKKDGSTSYTYQDIALATLLKEDTLYLTGYEQVNHFDNLKKVFPQVNHIGLGLVKVKGGKMSSSLGNVIFLSELLDILMTEFNDVKLAYNVFAGYILKANPSSDKIFDLDSFKNPKNSAGLYLSYTIARLKSAGVEATQSDNFNKKELQFNYIKSQYNLNPIYLFNTLVDLAKEINQLYLTHHIAGNEDNKQMFMLLLSDLVLGMNKLGMFDVDKV